MCIWIFENASCDALVSAILKLTEAQLNLKLNFAECSLLFVSTNQRLCSLRSDDLAVGLGPPLLLHHAVHLLGLPVGAGVLGHREVLVADQPIRNQYWNFLRSN